MPVLPRSGSVVFDPATRGLVSAVNPFPLRRDRVASEPMRTPPSHPLEKPAHIPEASGPIHTPFTVNSRKLEGGSVGWQP
jgi:hypothetical protein